MLFRPKDKDVDPRERAMWGELLNLGLVFPIAIVLGFYLGRWIGHFFGHAETGQWVGLVWGVATGFWELYKVTVNLNRLDQIQGQNDVPGGTRPEDTKEGKDGGDDA